MTGTTYSPEIQSCRNDGLYVGLAVAFISIAACIVLILWIYRLKRSQNGYISVRGNDDEIQKYKKMYEDEKVEKDKAFERLSKLISDRLTDGNPNIANLSDMKRPTKLAEDFSELYDNAWTEAYESLGGKQGNGEKENIRFLLKILQISFESCRRQATDQLTQLSWLLSCPGNSFDKPVQNTEVACVDKDLIKCFKDERKRLATQTSTFVSEKVFEEVKGGFKGKPWQVKLYEKAVEAYCKQCAVLSWYLVVQDPAMDIKFSGDKNGHFKAYTKNGNELDFIVWPPLYLHEGGNVMAKGVAQFR